MQMNPFVAECIGTAILILLGNGVVANVVLQNTKGSNGGWIVITFGWGMAVFVAVLCTAQFSGAHLNPAVTIGLVLTQQFSVVSAIGYILSQMIGACLGAVFVYITYKHHFDATDDASGKLACFCTSPNIRSVPSNFFSEMIGTFVLIFAVLCMAGATVEIQNDSGEVLQSGLVGLGSLGALPVALVVFSIGLSLGGTTGYAINPARDLGPRIVHAILPIKNKRDSDWGYAWIPILGPCAGAAFAAIVYIVTT